MRVIGGTARGRRLTAPSGRDVRPTSDRVREALFSSIAERVPGAVVLDCYAGSGALAIEALSRGAARAVLVERDRRATAAIAANLERAGVADRALVLRRDVARFCAAPTDGPFDLVFVDPPYAVPITDVHAQLTALHAAGGLARDAFVVVERDTHDPDVARQPPAFLSPRPVRTYGDTVLVPYAHRKEPS